MHPLRRQTSASISTLLDELEQFDFTKAERLQIVNLAPVTLVALVVVRPPSCPTFACGLQKSRELTRRPILAVRRRL